MSTIPNFYWIEHAQSFTEPRNDLFQEPCTIKDGHMTLNGKPGLGYELDEDWLEAHRMRE